MTGFNSVEVGPLGRTVELYEFAVQAGEFLRVTSSANAQTGGGQEYPVLNGLSRTNPVQGNEARAGEMLVTVPSNFEVAALFRGTLPSSLPTLTLFKKHLNDVGDELFTYWKGSITSCSFNDASATATLVCQPETRIFERPIPRAVFSGLCNHQLYDQGCQVVKADYSANLVLAAPDAAGTTFLLSGLRASAVAIDADLALGLTSDELDNFWMRGLVSSTASPSEHRMVVETNVGGEPNTIRINIPFRAVGVGDAITVVAGCVHSIDICNRKFQNAINFGGFPFVPTDNPFNIELDSGRQNGSITPTPNIFTLR